MKIAIIGAATGQLALCLKAKELGYETICFAWEDGAVCKDYVDKFYPISLKDKDAIVEKCRDEKVCGVLSNRSDFCAEVVAYVAEELGLIGNSYESMLKMKDKSIVRELSREVEGLSQLRFTYASKIETIPFLPCVIKPVVGSAKKGVWFVHEEDKFMPAFEDALDNPLGTVLVEEYIKGREMSVETISYRGKHFMLQITDKVNTGPPHFVDLAHHHPPAFSKEICKKIENVLKGVLDKANFTDGAAHVEFTINDKDDIYLLELNPRGAGDEISEKLVPLSTGYDYLKAMIDVAVGNFQEPKIENIAFAGVYYLCEQTKHLMSVFNNPDNNDLFIEKVIDGEELRVTTGNHDRNGFMIYRSNKKVSL